MNNIVFEINILKSGFVYVLKKKKTNTNFRQRIEITLK